MSYEEIKQCITLTASADLSTHQYQFCTLGSTGVAVNATAGGACLGVIDCNDADALGKRVSVAVYGVVKVKAGGTVAIGANVQSDASGDAITAAAEDYSQGIALAAAVDGDIFPVLLRSQAQINAAA